MRGPGSNLAGTHVGRPCPDVCPARVAQARQAAHPARNRTARRVRKPWDMRRLATRAAAPGRGPGPNLSTGLTAGRSGPSRPRRTRPGPIGSRPGRRQRGGWRRDHPEGQGGGPALDPPPDLSRRVGPGSSMAVAGMAGRAGRLQHGATTATRTHEASVMRARGLPEQATRSWAGGRGRDRRRASRRPAFVRPRGLRDSVLQSAQMIGGHRPRHVDRATNAAAGRSCPSPRCRRCSCRGRSRRCRRRAGSPARPNGRNTAGRC